MREKIAKNRNTILMVLGILIIVTFNIGMRYLVTRPRYKTLPEVTLRNKEPNKSGYAVMIPSDSGDGYIEYTSEDGTWPSEEEGYEFKEAKCIDNNGKLVEGAVTFESGKVTLTTSQTVYCTMYFDKKPEIIKILRENDPQNKLSSETVGGMYRFQGKNTDTINNYICFGTDNKEECACTDEKTCDDTKLDKYMYRIIGITEEGELYLIKMKGVEEGSNKTFLWTRKDENWSNNDVYKRLNGTSANGNPVFINNTRYNYMVDGNDWYNKIESHNWKYGNLSKIDTNNNGVKVYEIENAWSDYIPAKIGLMYLHDYYLAYDSNRNWYNDYDASNWIHFVNNKNTTGSTLEWLLTDYGIDEPRTQSCLYKPDHLYCSVTSGFDNCWVEPSLPCDCMISFVAQSTGDLSLQSMYSELGNLRPTFYLSSTVTIKSGIGSITDPFILSLN